MYHAIEKLQKNHLKWVNYWKLAESFLRQSEALAKVYLFTSLTPWNHEKKGRHLAFMDAQRAMGVAVIEARFRKTRRHCRAQQRNCKFWEEKENDVAIAVQMLGDAHAGSPRRMILITADTDQIPAVKYLRKTFRQIELSLGIPPDRRDEARDLGKLFNAPPREIDEGRLNACLLPDAVDTPNGAVQRPRAYAPP